VTTHKGETPLHRRIGDARFAPLTSEDQTRITTELAAAIAAGDERARRRLRDELIERHLRLVAAIGKGYEHKLDAEDIFAVGVVALTEAMERWNPSPGGMSAYQWAKRWITTALNKATDASRQIRIPEQVAYRAALNTKRIKERENALGRSLTEEEVEALTEGGPRLEGLPIADTSLTARIGANAGHGSELTVEDVIADDSPSAADLVERDDLFERVRASLASLTEEERIVVECRFGLNNADGKTLAELGRVLGTSGEAVRRLEASALAKLQHPANPLGIGEL